MSDVAVLGLAVDSSQAVAATTALNNLTNAANPAAAAAAALTSAAVPANVALTNLTHAASAASAAHAGMSTQGMAAFHSMRSFTEEMVAGMPVTMALAQQLNHLSYAASGPGGITGAFSEAIGSITKLVSPTMLLVGAGAAATIGIGLLTNSVAKSEVALDDLANRVGTTLSALHGLESAAAIKGIDTADFTKGMETFGTLTQQAKNNMGQLNTLFLANGQSAGTLTQNVATFANLMQSATSDAQRYQLLTEAGLPATAAWVQFWKQGADGIAQATDNAVKFGAVADAEMVAKARAFTESWNATWDAWENRAKSAIIDISHYMSGLSHSMYVDSSGNTQTISDLNAKQARQLGAKGAAPQTYGPPEPYGPPTPATLPAATSAANTSSLIDPAVAAAAAQHYSQLIGMLGQLASIDQQVQEKQNALNIANQNGVGISAAQEAAILARTRADALGITAINTQTDSVNISAAAYDMSVGAAAAYTSAQTKIQEAIRNGHPLFGQQLADLQKTADAYGEATQKAALLKAQSDADFASSQLGRDSTEQNVASSMKGIYGSDYESHMNDAIASQIRLNQTMADLKSTSSNALGQFLIDMKNGQGWPNSLSTALNSLENKMLNMAADKVMSSIIGTAMGNGTSGLSSLFSSAGSSATAASSTTFAADASTVAAATAHTGVGPGNSYGPKRYVDPSLFNVAPRFHSGVGPGEVPAIIRDDESVLTPGQMKALGVAISASNQAPPPPPPPATIVNVHNHSNQSADVKQSQGKGGGMQLDVLVGQIKGSIADDIARGGTTINTAMERRYALNAAYGNVRQGGGRIGR